MKIKVGPSPDALAAMYKERSDKLRLNNQAGDDQTMQNQQDFMNLIPAKQAMHGMLKGILG